MNFNQILAWVKSNIFIVIFSVLIIAAFVGMPLYSAKMNEQVQKAIGERKSKYDELRSIEGRTVSINVPGRSAVQIPGPITEQHAKAAEEYVSDVVEDAEETYSWALDHNRKGRNPLVPGVFPEMQIHEVPVKTEAMFRATIDAYERLLREIGAGQPPQLADIKDNLIRRERQWRIERNLLDPAIKLTDAQQNELKETLGLTRRAKYAEVAENIRIYASKNQLPLPSWALGQAQPSPADMFYWQWDFWVTEDVLKALNQANRGSATVQDSAVKRLISFRLLDEESRSRNRQSGGGGGGAGPGGGGGGGGGPILQGGGTGGNLGGGPTGPQPPGAGGGGNTGGGDGAAPSGAPLDPTVEVPWNFEYLTGRATNSLYDVRTVQVVLVVETRAIPVVLDAISQHNFMTIVDLQLTPADPYSAMVQGYVYGSEPVSNLVLEIETVWLRSWTAQFMPPALREQLKVVLPAPPADQPM